MAASVAGRGLHVDVLEQRHAPDLAVGDRVHRTAAGERDVRQLVTLVENVQQIEERLFVHRLRRTPDVAMTVFDRFARTSARPEKLLQRGGEEVCELGRSAAPFERDTFVVVAKVLHLQREGAVRS